MRNDPNLQGSAYRQGFPTIPDHPLLFHPSDHAMFGFSQDLLTLWRIPLQSDEDAFHFVDRTYPNRWRHHELSRLAPEQHILTSAIGKKVSLHLDDDGFSSPALRGMSDYVMGSHFLFVPDRDFPLSFRNIIRTITSPSKGCAILGTMGGGRLPPERQTGKTGALENG